MCKCKCTREPFARLPTKRPIYPWEQKAMAKKKKDAEKQHLVTDKEIVTSFHVEGGMYHVITTKVEDKKNAEPVDKTT